MLSHPQLSTRFPDTFSIEDLAEHIDLPLSHDNFLTENVLLSLSHCCPRGIMCSRHPGTDSTTR